MQSLEAVWETTSARLKSFIRSRVEDDATADDLLQEVFVRVHLNMKQLKDSERLESWIFQITRHTIIDHYRTRRTAMVIPENHPDPIELFVEPDASQELSGSIRQMVDELPEKYRVALLLTEYEGLTQQGLADRLGITLSGAKSRVQRARQMIKNNLLACCHFECDRYGRIIEYWEHCCCCTE